MVRSRAGPEVERKFREVKEGMAGEKRYKAAMAGQRIGGTEPPGADNTAHAAASSSEHGDLSFRWDDHSSSSGDPGAPSLLNGLHELYQYHHHQHQGQYQQQSHSPMDRWRPGRAPSHGHFDEEQDTWRRASGSAGSPSFWHDHHGQSIGAMTPTDLRRMSDYDMSGSRGSFSSFSFDATQRGSDGGSYPPVYVSNQAGHGTIGGTPISGIGTSQPSVGLGGLSASPASYSFNSQIRRGSAMSLQLDGFSHSQSYGNEVLDGSSGSSGAAAHGHHAYPPPLSLESLFPGHSSQHYSAVSSAPPVDIGQAISTGFLSSAQGFRMDASLGSTSGGSTPAPALPVQPRPAQGSSYERMYGERLPDINEDAVANHSLLQPRPSFRHTQTDHPHPPHSSAVPRVFPPESSQLEYAPLSEIGSSAYTSAHMAGAGAITSKPAFSCPASIHTSPLLTPATAPIPPPAPWSESFRSAFQSSFNSLSRPQLSARGRAATTGQPLTVCDGSAPQAFPISLSPDTPGFSSPSDRFFTQGPQSRQTAELRIAAPAAPPPLASWSMGFGTANQDVSISKPSGQPDDHDVVMGEGAAHDNARQVDYGQRQFLGDDTRMMSKSHQPQPDSGKSTNARVAPSLTLDMSFRALGHLGSALGPGGVGTNDSSPITTMPSTPFPVATGWARQQTQPGLLAGSGTTADRAQHLDHSLDVQVERVGSNAKPNLVDSAVADHRTGISAQVATQSGDSWGTAGTTIDPKLVSPLKSTWSSPTATRATMPLLHAAACRTASLLGGQGDFSVLSAPETIAKPAASPPGFVSDKQILPQTMTQRSTEPSGLSLAGSGAALPPPPPPLRRASDSDTPPLLKSAHGCFPGDGSQSFPPH